jgi:hypothetical protein
MNQLCMMKQIKIFLLTMVPFLSGLAMYGQARDASVMIDNENRNAVMITIDQPEKITREALRQRMERSGLKEKARNGMVKYKGVMLSEISQDKVDIYTKVEKGPNDGSVVYMAVSRGYNNFTNSEVDSNITQNVKTFLQSFVKDADYHSSDVAIGSQIADINNDEKLYQRLLNEQNDLQNKKSNIDKRLMEIQNELLIKRDNIDKKKSGLEVTKDKRATINQ